MPTNQHRRKSAVSSNEGSGMHLGYATVSAHADVCERAAAVVARAARDAADRVMLLSALGLDGDRAYERVSADGTTETLWNLA